NTEKPSDFKQFLGTDTGNARWSYCSYASIIAGGNNIPAVGIAPGHGAVLYPSLLAGRAPRRPNEIALGTHTLAVLHTRVGGTIPVSLGDRTARMHVVGRVLFPAFGQGSFTPTGLGDGALLTAPVAAQLQNTPAGQYNFMLVRFAPSARHAGEVSSF